MGTQWVTFLKEEVQIWSTTRLKMQAAGVSEIEKGKNGLRYNFSAFEN